MQKKSAPKKVNKVKKHAQESTEFQECIPEIPAISDSEMVGSQSTDGVTYESVFDDTILNIQKPVQAEIHAEANGSLGGGTGIPNLTTKPNVNNHNTNQNKSKVIVESKNPELKENFDEIIVLNENKDVKETKHSQKKNVNQAFETQSQEEKEGWQQVKNKRSMHMKKSVLNTRQEPLKGTNNSTNCLLKSAQKMTQLFLTGLDQKTTSENIKEFLKANNLDVDCSCEKIRTKNEKYCSSFKLTVPVEHRHLYHCSELWPQGVAINHFQNLKNLGKVQVTSQHQHNTDKKITHSK